MHVYVLAADSFSVLLLGNGYSFNWKALSMAEHIHKCIFLLKI